MDDEGISIIRAPASSSAFFRSDRVISPSLVPSESSVQIIQGLLPVPFCKFRRSLQEVGRRRWVSMMTGLGSL